MSSELFCPTSFHLLCASLTLALWRNSNYNIYWKLCQSNVNTTGQDYKGPHCDLLYPAASSAEMGESDMKAKDIPLVACLRAQNVQGLT